MKGTKIHIELIQEITVEGKRGGICKIEMDGGMDNIVKMLVYCSENNVDVKTLLLGAAAFIVEQDPKLLKFFDGTVKKQYEQSKKN